MKAILYWAIVVSLYTACSFTIGGTLTEVKYLSQLETCRAEVEHLLDKEAMRKHGNRYHYVKVNGHLYYVKNPKDIDNEAKWICAR